MPLPSMARHYRWSFALLLLGRLPVTGNNMDRRRFIGGTALAAALPLLGMQGAMAATRGQLLAAGLNKGDTVGLVSPS